jgi:cation:H+ antiporter
MILDFVFLIFGFVLLIKGADIMVDGSASIAKKFGVSALVIGLTIIAFGTSAPELIVNVMSSIEGSSDIGMGNIIGSNISNILLILGVSAIFATIKVDTSIIRKQIPFSILAVLALFVLVNASFFDGIDNNYLTRSGGIILLMFFSIFIYYTFSNIKSNSSSVISEVSGAPVYKNWKSTLMIVGGAIALFFGGRFIVQSSVSIAEIFGLSEALIGLTVVAIGTSLPELAASVSAARKNQTEMAVGNIIGSNIFNILWVLSISSIIRPIEYNPAINSDMIFLIFVSLLLFPLIYLGKKRKFTKNDGYILVAMYIIYLIFVIIRG